MAEPKHKTGVIGLGIMGRRMVTNLARHRRFDATCAWDPDPQACADAVAETPGLIIMAIIQNAYANTVSSVMISKIQGNIVDMLMPPLSPGEFITGFVKIGRASCRERV